MAAEDIEVEGTVTVAHRGGLFTVRTEKDTEVLVRPCGKMRKHMIRIEVGDRVTVGLSPYDLTQGRILFRYK